MAAGTVFAPPSRRNAQASPVKQESVSAGLIRAVHDAERASQAVGSRLPVQREAVIRSREDLLALADRLRSEEPASWLGVELARELLTDVDSPLYTAGGDLRAAVRRALAALDGR